MQTRENILHPHDKGLISRRQEPKQTIRVQQQAKDSVGVIMGNVSNRLRCLTLDPQPLVLFEEGKETLRDGALKEELHPWGGVGFEGLLPYPHFLSFLCFLCGYEK